MGRSGCWRDGCSSFLRWRLSSWLDIHGFRRNSEQPRHCLWTWTHQTSSETSSDWVTTSNYPAARLNDWFTFVRRCGFGQPTGRMSPGQLPSMRRWKPHHSSLTLEDEPPRPSPDLDQRKTCETEDWKLHIHIDHQRVVLLWSNLCLLSQNLMVFSLQFLMMRTSGFLKLSP